MRNIFLIIVSFLMFNQNFAQETKKERVKAPKKYFYMGADVGFSLLGAQFSYNKSYSELNSQIKYNHLLWTHSRLYGGYQLGMHRFELSIQNLAIKTGFTIKFNTDDKNLVVDMLRKGSTYFSLGYLIRPVQYKWFQFNVGPHFGLAIAGNSDFGAEESYSSILSNAGTVVDEIYVERKEVKKHQTFFNFGGRLNLLFEVSPKIELSLNTSILYTPYNIRGFNVRYNHNMQGIKEVQALSNILTYTLGVGINYRFFRKNKIDTSIKPFKY